MKIVKRINEGEIVPGGYGIAWYEWTTRGAVCLPLGFNVIASAFRVAYFALRGNWNVLKASPLDAYHQGVKVGRAMRPLDRQ